MGAVGWLALPRRLAILGALWLARVVHVRADMYIVTIILVYAKGSLLS